MKRKLVKFFSEISEKYIFLLEAKIIYWATMPTYPSFLAKLFFFLFFGEISWMSTFKNLK